MALKTHKFARKTFYVDAVRVSESNIEEIAQWCGGEIKEDPNGLKYIAVEVQRPLNERQTQAFVNDWVLSTNTGFKVFTQKAFDKQFEKVKYLTKEQADEAGIKPPHEPRPKNESKKPAKKGKPSPGHMPKRRDSRRPIPNPVLTEEQAKNLAPQEDYRSAETGRFVSEAEATASPETTVKEVRDAKVYSASLVPEEGLGGGKIETVESTIPVVETQIDTEGLTAEPTKGKTKADIEADKLVAEVHALSEKKES